MNLLDVVQGRDERRIVVQTSGHRDVVNVFVDVGGQIANMVVTGGRVMTPAT